MTTDIVGSYRQKNNFEIRIPGQILMRYRCLVCIEPLCRICRVPRCANTSILDIRNITTYQTCSKIWAEMSSIIPVSILYKKLE